MKRVLFIIETLRGGGAERALSNIVMHFPDDWCVDILINDKSLVEYPYKGNLISLYAPEKKSAIYFTRNIIKRIFLLRKLKLENGYEACVSFLDSASISNVLSGNKHCKTIVSIRNNMMSNKTGLVEKIGTILLIKLLYIHADKIISVSKEIETILVNKLKISENKVQTIVNGYDSKWIREKMRIIPANKILSLGRDRSKLNVVVTVGRLVDQKGQWHLIRAFSEVIKKEPQTVLVIIGEGILKEYLRKLIESCSLEGKVFLAGYSENPFWYNALADTFVLPSLYEGYPNALAEAVCCGTPCIATDVHSGVREILAPDLNVMGKRVVNISEEEYGVLIPVCSGRKYGDGEYLETEEQMMAEAIIEMLSNNKKREYYRKKSLERSFDLDINSVLDKWIGIISEK